MEELAKVLKIFVEKRLVPTVIGIVAAVGLVAILPEDSVLIEKLGRPLFIILAWGIVFLLVLGIVELWKKIASHKQKKESVAEHQEYVDKRNKEVLESYWDFVDKLSPEDRKCLRQFIETNNKPIEKNGPLPFMDEGLWGSQIVCFTEVEKPVTEQRLGKSNLYASYSMPVGGKKLFRLKDDAYAALKYGYEKYGKISHFE